MEHRNIPKFDRHFPWPFSQFPSIPRGRFSVVARWSDLGQALARGSHGVLIFLSAWDVCKDINEAQRARFYPNDLGLKIWEIRGKWWENGGKMVGKS